MSVQVPLTFLDLCQRTQQECGIAGNLLTTVQNQSGELLRLCSWVTDAWMEIQGQHQDHNFFRSTVTFPTDTTRTAYSPANAGLTAGTFSQWAQDSARNYVTSTGITSEIFMEWMDYERWRDSYLYGATRTVRSRASVFSIAPDKSLVFGPIFDNGYTVLIDYFIAPQPLINDSDTPTSVSAAVGASGAQGTVPYFWNMLIVYKAMMSYGAYEHAPEVYNRGEAQSEKFNRRLLQDQLPQIHGPGALA